MFSSVSAVDQKGLTDFMIFGIRETTKSQLSLPPFYTQHLLLELYDLFKMVKTAIDLGPYKAQMSTWFMDENKTAKEITELLYSLYNVVVVSQTIERRFKD